MKPETKLQRFLRAIATAEHILVLVTVILITALSCGHVVYVKYQETFGTYGAPELNH
jgi:hypothetical protein